MGPGPLVDDVVVGFRLGDLPPELLIIEGVVMGFIEGRMDGVMEGIFVSCEDGSSERFFDGLLLRKCVGYVDG